MEIIKKPYRVLVVDDDEEDFILATEYLNELGIGEYTYEWASSFDKGAKVMAESRHDIYLIDHLLGAGTGIELIKMATENGCRAPKILLTGVGNLELDMQAIKSGADDYLPKIQMNTETLERTLRHALRRYEQYLLFQNQQARFKTLFEQSVDPIYVTDGQWKFVDANNSLLKLFNLEHEELLKKNLGDLFSDKKIYQDFKKEIEQEQGVVNFTCTLQLQDSEEEIICLISSAPIVDFENQGVGYQGMIRDITQLKKAEKELMQAEQMNLTGRMARTIAHEVRNPLTNINLAADELGEQIEGNDDLVFFTDIIKRSSSRINNLISDLLNSTKLAKLDIASTAIEEVLQDVLLWCDDRIQLKQITVNTSGMDANTFMQVDPEKLKIVFVNIITNAIEAMEEIEKPSLSIGLSVAPREVTVRISDNGKGMDEHTLKHLFEAFFTGRNGGMGLGMTAVQNIVSQHQGKISVESEPGKGTSFIVQIPRN